ncbi:glycosyl transferase family 64 domain-containing protein [Umbelopsis sp. AD052]|nr:glycosyl transferase family 64 domain-containing protein [Umbelopsis sp. AD052]
MFDGNIKPWNWYTAHDDAWLKNWDPDSMWHWRHHRNAIQYLFSGSKGRISFPITDKFSVLLSTYNPDRIDHVTTLIRHLATSDLVHTIYLTWHNPKLEVNKELKELQEKLRKPLVILRQQFDSLNNRFNPIEGLETSAVYILDDDIVVSVPDLEFSFQVWQNRQHSIVGHFPRFHTYSSANGQATYAMADAKRPTYSIVLTKSMFIRSEYLFAYTCLMDPAMHEYVDANLNCEDIGFSLMVSGLTSVTNVYVAVKSRIRDYGLSQGISTNGNHIKARRQCISNMIGTFWKGNDPTRMTNEMVSAFEAAHFTRGTWDQLAKEVESIENRT